MKCILEKFLILVALTMLYGCGYKAAKNIKRNSTCYRKTTFDVDSAELNFLAKHNNCFRVLVRGHCDNLVDY